MSNITSYYMERAERLRWLGVGKPQLHAPRLMPRTKAMVAAAASLARAKENPNALPDRIELLLHCPRRVCTAIVCKGQQATCNLTARAAS